MEWLQLSDTSPVDDDEASSPVDGRQLEVPLVPLPVTWKLTVFFVFQCFLGFSFFLFFVCSFFVFLLGWGVVS